MATDFVPTATDMVQGVRNIIEGYGMGPLRALAQEPVQNSKDAKCQSQVRVEYQLHKRTLGDGKECFLLTVTDSGTTGLQGTILSREARDAQGPVLEAGENWAAFEGQGFTKKDQSDALGSRGQGKAAFLYHSRPTGPQGNQLNRHLILYDTLLADREYRLGVRYAMPDDRVQEPPFLNGDARDALSGTYDTGNEIMVPLNLEPLAKPGTRVIVPYLSVEALNAIRTGELHRWLERCWWRAIQTGKLSIAVTDETGQSKKIQPPAWWQTQPWLNGDDRVQVHEDVEIDGNLKIKRIVLLYDEDLEADEIEDQGTQYSGVQLLRGQQWIETLDVWGYIPKERLAGFRGFAEFEKQLERELKKAEKPQHESFEGRTPVVKGVRDAIRGKVKQFAEQRGWLNETESQDAPQRAQEFALEFLSVFVPGAGTTRRKRGKSNGVLEPETQLNWNCELMLDFPTAKSSRVNWGETISNVGVAVECEPFQSTKQVDISLELSREGEKELLAVARKEGVAVPDGREITTLGDFQIVQGHAGTGNIQAAEPGEWSLRAKVWHGGEPVASATRRLYVEEEPPDPPQPKPHTISVKVQNISRQGQRRINNGDEMSVQVTVTNRAVDEAPLRVDASLEDKLLSDGKEVRLAGVPAGDVPTREAVVSERLHVFTSPLLTPSEPHIVLPPGRHFLRADLWAPDCDKPVVHASQPIYVEVDPGGNRNRLPFKLESIEDKGPHPMWELEMRSEDEWVLKFPSQYPIYRQLQQPQRLRSKLAGQQSFLAEICANGLLEWALDPLSKGDRSRVDQLIEAQLNGSSAHNWDVYSSQIERLAELYDNERINDFGAYTKRLRQTVAAMLVLFEGMD